MPNENQKPTGTGATALVPSAPICSEYLCQQAFRSETGMDATYQTEDYHYPGRYNTHWSERYIEWLEDRVAATLPSNVKRRRGGRRLM